MTAAQQAAVDELEASLRDMPPAHITKLIDVCAHQVHEIATTLATIGLPGAERIRFLSAVTALAARQIAEPVPMSEDETEEIRRIFDRLRPSDGGRS